MSKSYYFGCVGGPGHYLWSTGMRQMFRDEKSLPVPIGTLDGGLLPPGGEGFCKQGYGTLCHISGWTILSFWDHSIDTRPNCVSVYLIEKILDTYTMCEECKKLFPSVWSRYEFDLRIRPVCESDAYQPIDPRAVR